MNIQLHQRYVHKLDADNPFAEYFQVPVDIKGGWVKYRLSDTQVFSSKTVDDFEKWHVLQPEVTGQIHESYKL